LTDEAWHVLLVLLVQHRQRHLRQLSPIQDRLDDFQRQQRQPQHATS